MLELVQAILDLDHLVDLFLILGDHETRAAVIQNIGHLFGGGVLIQRHRDRADGFRGYHRPVHVRTVAPDDRDEIALVDAKIDQTQREIGDLGFGLFPGPALPDAEFFFAIGGAIAVFGGVTVQQRRDGRKSTRRL